MSENYGLYYDCCLRGNPFEPAIADARKPEDIILEGTEYIKYVKELVFDILEAKNETKKVIILQGSVGSGKTAILKRVLYELKLSKITTRQETIIGEVDKKIILYQRVPIGIDFNNLLFVALKELAKHYGISGIESKMKSPSINSLLNLTQSILTKTGKEVIVLIFDQLERAKDINVPDAIDMLREYFNKLGTTYGCILIFSTVARADIEQLGLRLDHYIGNVRKILLVGIRKDEAKLMIEKLFEHYRIDEKCKEKIKEFNAYYPFTEDGLDVVLDELYRSIRSDKALPRELYEFLGNVLKTAVTRGLIPINKDVAYSILNVVGFILLGWLESLNEPYQKFKRATIEVIKLAAQLEETKKIDLQKNRGCQVEIEAVLTNPDYIMRLLEVKSNVNKEEVRSVLPRAVDALIVLRLLTDGKRLIYLVKVGVKPTKSIIENLGKLLDSINGFKVKGATFRLDSCRYKIICLDRLPKTVEEGLNLIKAITPISDVGYIAIPQEDPRTYGAIMYTYKLIENQQIEIKKSDVVASIRSIFNKIFEDLVHLL